MLVAEAAKEISNIPSSDSIIERMDQICADIKDILMEKLKESGKCFLLIDDSADNCGASQLLASVQCIVGESNDFYQELESQTNGKEIFRG